MPLVFALLLPLVFLHAEYQPSWTVGQATLYLSDLAVLAIGGLGLASGLREGFGPLRPGRAVWAAAAAFLLVVFCSNVYGALREDGYAFVTHFLTAAKFAEYALLALAAPLVLRRASDLEYPLATLTAWSCAATTGALLQFLGVLNEFEGRRPGQREPSFLGIHDLAALSGATLSLGIIGIAVGRPRWAAVVAGAVGAVLGASIFAYGGIVLAAGFVVLAARRRLTAFRAAAVAGIVAVVGAGVVALRSYDTSHFLSFLGIKKAAAESSEDVQTGSQRAMLGYIGVRLWRDHPLLGVGFE